MWEKRNFSNVSGKEIRNYELLAGTKSFLSCRFWILFWRGMESVWSNATIREWQSQRCRGLSNDRIFLGIHRRGSRELLSTSMGMFWFHFVKIDLGHCNLSLIKIIINSSELAKNATSMKLRINQMLDFYEMTPNCSCIINFILTLGWSCSLYSRGSKKWDCSSSLHPILGQRILRYLM